MCGIAAIFAYSPDAPGVERGELIAIRDRMTARGPDGAGEWISPDGRIGLAHRRLSIIDLSEAGAQPMWNHERTLCVTFNGEIYNYQELRSKLIAQGYRFYSGTDTEVLLHLYAEKGAEMVDELRGMYAFAIWDSRQRSLFLARDPFGIKPLYYADDGRNLRVASQVKALLQSKQIYKAPEPAGHVGFFLWGHVPDPFTLYCGIKALPAGHTLLVSEDHGAASHEPREFCSIPGLLRSASSLDGPNSSLEAPRLPDLLRSSLSDSISHHLIADVPVGVFQSAGLDSSTLTAYVSQVHSHVRTVTLGFQEYRGTHDDEVPLAEAVARQFKTDHHTIWVSRGDFENDGEKIMGAMDQPSTDGVNTYFVSMAAKRAGLKVALSGLGGDELFGGYSSFQEIPRAVRALRPFGVIPSFGRGFRLVSSRFLKRFTSPKYAALFEYGTSFGGAYLLRRGMFMPWELVEFLDPDMVREGWSRLNTLPLLNATAENGGRISDRMRVSALELSWYMRNQLLRDSDWAGMAHSLEIRVPLVDVNLLRSLLPALGSENPPSKLDMARSPNSQLPSAVLDRQKTGFAVPVREWLLQTIPNSELRIPNSKERGLRGWTREVYARFGGTSPTNPHPRAVPQSRLPAPGQVRSNARGFPAPLDVGVSSTRVDKPQSSPCTSQPDATNRILVLLTDGFGGFGGIAKFNRDFLTALCSHPRTAEVVALSRLMPHAPGTLPPKLTYVTGSLGGKARFMRAVVKSALLLRNSRGRKAHSLSQTSEHLIVCGHINLLPAALLAKKICGGSVHLIIHGIEAWRPVRSPLTNACVRHIDGFISVSEVTKQRFIAWSGLRAEQGVVLPNCVDLSAFAPGPKPAALIERYGLRGKKVIMTLGRLASEERYKGFDEVLEVLPKLAAEIPDLCYLIVGDGPDRARLVKKAKALGAEVLDFGNKGVAVPLGNSPNGSCSDRVSAPCPRVIFAGRISDAEKADHYRTADLYVMPSSGEGFGIVYLEAMACGIPLVGSKTDGSREALRGGMLGALVDPCDPDEVFSTVLKLLKAVEQKNLKPPGPESVNYFSAARFEHRLHKIMDCIGKPVVNV